MVVKMNRFQINQDVIINGYLKKIEENREYLKNYERCIGYDFIDIEFK